MFRCGRKLYLESYSAAHDGSGASQHGHNLQFRGHILVSCIHDSGNCVPPICVSLVTLAIALDDFDRLEMTRAFSEYALYVLAEAKTALASMNASSDKSALVQAPVCARPADRVSLSPVSYWCISPSWPRGSTGQAKIRSTASFLQSVHLQSASLAPLGQQLTNLLAGEGRWARWARFD